MCTLFNVPLYSHQRLQDHLIIINREDLNKAFKNSVDNLEGWGHKTKM